MCSLQVLALSLFLTILSVMTIEGSTRKANRSQKWPVTTTQPSIMFDNSCSISSFEVCLTKIQEVTQNSSLAFASNKKDLTQACRKLKEGDTCAENHMKNCTNKSQKMLFQEIVRGTKQVLNSLCETGEFQNNYLRFAPCFKNVSMSEEKCAPVLKKFQSMSTTVQSGENVEEGLKKFCCAFRESVYCQINFVRRDCGERAVQFFEKYLSEISNSLMHQHCATYTFSDSCNPRIGSLNQSIMPQCSSFIIILFTMFTLQFSTFFYSSFNYSKYISILFVIKLFQK